MAIVTEFVKNVLCLISGWKVAVAIITICIQAVMMRKPLPHPTLDYQIILLI